MPFEVSLSEEPCAFGVPMVLTLAHLQSSKGIGIPTTANRSAKGLEPHPYPNFLYSCGANSGNVKPIKFDKIRAAAVAETACSANSSIK